MYIHICIFIWTCMNRYADRWMDPHPQLLHLNCRQPKTRQRPEHKYKHVHIYSYRYKYIDKHFSNVSSLKNLPYTSTILLTTILLTCDFFDPQQPPYTVAPSHR